MATGNISSNTGVPLSLDVSEEGTSDDIDKSGKTSFMRHMRIALKPMV